MNMRSAFEELEAIGLAPAKIDLPYLPSNIAKSRQRVAQREISGTATLLGHDWTVSQGDHPLDGTIPATVLTCDIGGVLTKIATKTDLLAMVAARADLASGLDTLSATQRALVVEHVLSDDLARLEDQFGTSIEIREAETNVSFPIAEASLCLTARTDGAVPMRLYLQSDDTDAFLAALEAKFPARAARDMGWVRTRTAIIGPLAKMPAVRLSQLAVGDVFLPAPGWSDRDAELFLQVSDQHIAPLTHSENGGVQIDGPTVKLSQIIHLNEQDTTMTATDTNATLADPNVLITVELTRTDMPVSQLQLVQDGDVIDFDINQVETVTICTNGKPFAEGTLVQLDDAVGVHVKKIL